MHIECKDKTNSIVAHCNCSPGNPDLKHRHVFKYWDLLDPPAPIHQKELQTSSGFLDIYAIRRLLILAHPHYPAFSTRTTRSSMAADNGSEYSSTSSFEIQVRTTKPEDFVITAGSLKMKVRREGQDCGELLVQVCLLWKTCT
jgi:hypothetical protein